MRAAQAQINLSAIRANLAAVRELAPRSKVLAIVKADGYGHGIVRVAGALSDADAYGVASLDDAAVLRDAGVRHRIVLLSGFDAPADLPHIRALDLDCVLHDPSQLAMLTHDRGSAIRLWPKIDTGMHRLGFAADQATMLRATLAALSNVAAEQVWMSHLASADMDSGHNAVQLRSFCAATDALNVPRSMANSAATLRFPAMHFDWVRPGGLLYGLSTIAGRTGADLGFQPAMRVSSRLIAVKDVQPGARIGYAETFVAEHPMRIGIVGFGYGDGYPRRADTGSTVWIAGRIARLLGRVSMDLLCIDLSAMPDVGVGAEVELWGSNLPVEQVAEAAGTISYELTCGITRRVRFVESA